MAALSPRALCGLEDVRQFGYDPSTSEEDMDFWLDNINAASDEFHRVAQREFVSKKATRATDNDPITVPLETRIYDIGDCVSAWDIDWDLFGWPGAPFNQFGGYVLRLRNSDLMDDGATSPGPPALGRPAAVRTKTYDGVLQQTATLSTIISLPRIREPWQPVTELWFLGGLTNSLNIGPNLQIEVDARFGFPQIPDAIRRLCANQAAIWMARDVRHFSSTFNLDSQRMEVVRDTLAPAILKAVKRFKRPTVG